MVIDNNGCLDSSLFSINDINYHTAEFDYNPLNILAESTVSFNDLSIDTSVNWLWDFGEGSIDTLQNTNFIFNYPGDYTICLTSTNNFNCIDTYCQNITVIANELVIPNIFTPNNDHLNDYFVIEGINDQFEFSILNRWGETLYNAYPYLNNWEGRTFSGIQVPEGTYVFILTNHQENINYTGTFLLAR